MRTIRFSSAGWSLAAAVVLGALIAPDARAQALLRWHFREGESLKYVLDQSTKVHISMNQQTYENVLKQVIDSSWKVKSVADGTAEIAQSFDRIRTSIDAPGTQINYDSKDGKIPEGPFGALGQIMSALAGAEITFKMNPRGEVSDVSLPAKVIDAIKTMPGAAAAGPMFTEEGIKKLITQSTLTLPEEASNPGEEWPRTAEVQAPNLGSMVLTHTFTYKGPEIQDGVTLERIDLKIETEIKPEGDAPKLNVKEQKSTGFYLFDNNKGHLEQSNISQKMEIVVKGPNNVEITQSNETTSTMKLVP